MTFIAQKERVALACVLLSAFGVLGTGDARAESMSVACPVVEEEEQEPAETAKPAEILKPSSATPTPRVGKQEPGPLAGGSHKTESERGPRPPAIP